MESVADTLNKWEKGECFIWEEKVLVVGDAKGFRYDSPRAGGKYEIINLNEGGSYIDAHDELSRMRSLDDRAKARLTTILVDLRREGEECPRLTREMLESAEKRPNLSVVERADRLLQFFGEKTRSMGQRAEYNYSEACARSESINIEPGSLGGFLEEEGLISVGNHSLSGLFSPRIKPKGFIHLENLRKGTLDSSKVFVAMWFDESVEHIYSKVIEPAIVEAGYEPTRIDKTHFNSKVDDKIIADIRRARFIIADFTCCSPAAKPKKKEKAQPRGSVYYEAGFAHGLSREVIFTCCKNCLKHDVAFDTRQYNFILWEKGKLGDFKENIKNRIGATIGYGPTAENAPQDSE